MGFVVDLVADADEECAARACAQLGQRVRNMRIGEVDPADDSADEFVVRGGGEEFACLVQV